jgi:hypothetical protein
MAIGAYTNPTWANGGTPAINAANLQAATDQIKNITDAAVSGGASPTKIWTSTNDGNAGQPPAPKPSASPAGGADAPGQFTPVAYFAAGASVYYSGATNKTGIWKCVIRAITVATGLPNEDHCGQAIGTGSLGTVPAGEAYYIYTERLS